MTNEEMLMVFFAKQDRDWQRHRREIGWFGRLFENLFGSDFARKQIEEYKQFCESHSFYYSPYL